MYVQFQIPANKKANMPPVIMVHGSTHTAACLESTPDGREGWAPYFVRKGISTYIVDQAGRGRSGFDESVIHEAAAMVRNGDAANGVAKIPDVRPDYRQRRVDCVVRASRPGRIEHPDGNADSPRRSGRPADRRRSHANDYFPAYPFDDADPNIVARDGRDRGRRRRTEQLLRARVLQAAGAERGGHAARLDLRDVRSEGDARRPIRGRRRIWRCWSNARRRDRRHAFAVGHHGPPHGPHPEGARSSGHAEGAHHDRRVLLAPEQRAQGGGLRQHSVYGAEGRLHGDERGVRRPP